MTAAPEFDDETPHGPSPSGAGLRASSAESSRSERAVPEIASPEGAYAAGGYGESSDVEGPASSARESSSRAGVDPSGPTHERAAVAEAEGSPVDLAHEGMDTSAAAAGYDDEAPAPGRFEPRARAAWQSWLSALATDAEAALAAALAYDSLDSEGRDAWLDVLDQDADEIGVPRIALYAPLLSVEADEGRRARMLHAVAPARLERAAADQICAYRGVREDGMHVIVIVAPVYLDFVEVLTCQYQRDGGVVFATRDPLRHVDVVTSMLHERRTELEPTPLSLVVDELAHAILADRREGREAPEALGAFAHLFGPDKERWGDAST